MGDLDARSRARARTATGEVVGGDLTEQVDERSTGIAPERERRERRFHHRRRAYTAVTRNSPSSLLREPDEVHAHVGRNLDADVAPPLQEVDVVAELAERVVAPDAQQATDHARLVLVIDVERRLLGRATTDRTPAVLSLEQRFVAGTGEAEGTPEVSVAFLCLTTLPVRPPVLVQVFLVLLLPSLDVRDRLLAVCGVPRTTYGARTALALRAVAVGHPGGTMEFSERQYLAALLASLHPKSVRGGYDTYALLHVRKITPRLFVHSF